MHELWIVHHSIDLWQEPGRWTGYLEEAQRVLGLSLTHLDVDDRMKRKIPSLAEAGKFICAFKPREDSRWLFGKLDESGVGFSIQHHRQIEQWPNSLKWHIPLSFLDKPENSQRLKALFDIGNRTLMPFYSYGDEVDQVARKKKSFGAVDIQAELLGVFWLTYFNTAYVAFFGNDKFNGFPVVEHGSDGSITIVLGDGPESVTSELREQSAATLGKKSFVSPSDILSKPPGRFALTFQQLRSWC